MYHLMQSKPFTLKLPTSDHITTDVRIAPEDRPKADAEGRHGLYVRREAVQENYKGVWIK